MRVRATRGIAAVAVAAAVGFSIAAAGGTAVAGQPGARAHFAKVGTHYAVYQRLCAAPKANHAACMAIRRVPASKANPSAHAYAVKAAFPVGPGGGLTPGDLSAAYAFNADAPAGATQTVAIVDAYNDPNIAADLGVFDTEYGLPAETASSFRVVGQDGTTTLPANDTTGWSGEESLDVETVRGVCHLCKIVLIEADSPSNLNLSIAVNTAANKLHATEISNSYGGPEGKHKFTPALAKQIAKPYNHKGVVITASTGDDGWFSWDKMNVGVKSAESPNIPSSLPHVVSVGGTFLELNDDATRLAESTWNANGLADFDAGQASDALGATGGGCSVSFTAPGWQSNVAGYAKTGCGKHRLAADVAADADPASGFDVYISYNCGNPQACGSTFPVWEPIGGTSLSAPLIAAMWALAGGSGGTDYPAASLYGHFAAGGPGLYDVTKGGNSWCDKDPNCSADTEAQYTGVVNPNDFAFGGTIPVGTVDCGFKRKTAAATLIAANHQCNAAAGYDGPTGVGTPNGLSVFKAMSPKPKIHHGKAKRQAKTHFSVGGSDPFPGGRFVTFHWKYGDGHSGGGATPSHTYAQAGKYAVSVKVTDNYGQSAIATANVIVKR